LRLFSEKLRIVRTLSGDIMQEPIDISIDLLLTETLELIPSLFANDPKTKMLLTKQIPNIKAYTKKMWRGIGARSSVDYVVLSANLSTAFVTARPGTVLKCGSYAEFLDSCAKWIAEEFQIDLTPEEIEGKEALIIITSALGEPVNRKLATLGSTRKS
jgi:hypothetical protein